MWASLFSAAGQVLIAPLSLRDGRKILPGLEWQMPQGDADEDPRDAVMREL